MFFFSEMGTYSIQPSVPEGILRKQKQQLLNLREILSEFHTERRKINLFTKFNWNHWFWFLALHLTCWNHPFLLCYSSNSALETNWNLSLACYMLLKALLIKFRRDFAACRLKYLSMTSRWCCWLQKKWWIAALPDTCSSNSCGQCLYHFWAKLLFKWEQLARYYYSWRASKIKSHMTRKGSKLQILLC